MGNKVDKGKKVERKKVKKGNIIRKRWEGRAKFNSLMDIK